MGRITIATENINSIDANELIDELSDVLMNITGDSGRGSFDNSDMNNSRSVFVIAKEEGRAVGCGAFREISIDTAEIKRMYTRKKSCGIGKRIITYLEANAKEFGYNRTVLETRRCNENAVNFYLNNGYKIISNYDLRKDLLSGLINGDN